MFTAPEWTGLANYERLLLRNRRFFTALEVTAKYVFSAVPLRLTFALMVALLLNRGIRGLGIYYLPSLLGGSLAFCCSPYR